MAVPQENRIRKKIGKGGVINVASNIPSIADSMVPAVAGSTNLLRDNICIMSPHTAIELPDRTKAIVRGILLTTSRFTAWKW